MDKIKVAKPLDDLYLSGCSPERVIELIQESVARIKQSYPEVEDLTIEIDYYSDDVAMVQLWGYRLELDYEYKKRMAATQSQEQRDRELYERLKAKFETKT